MNLELDGWALVVGAGGHLMSEIAIGLAKSGSKVVCADFNLENAKSTELRISNLGYTAKAFKLDVTDLESIKFVKNALLAEGIFVKYLVNGAGLNAPTPFMEINQKEWIDILSVQLIGVGMTCQVFGAEMLNKAGGSIVNISSASAGPPLSKAFVYSAAKAGVLNLTKNLAREWGLTGVRVNALRPGFFPNEWAMKNFIDDERRENIFRHTPMRRFGQPNELIAAVIWLLSDHSTFVTGSEIAIDGGFSAMTI